MPLLCVQILASFPHFCSSVCVQYNTRKRKNKGICLSSTPVYYTEHKPKNKKPEGPGDEAMQILSDGTTHPFIVPCSVASFQALLHGSLATPSSNEGEISRDAVTSLLQSHVHVCVMFTADLCTSVGATSSVPQTSSGFAIPVDSGE